MRLKQRPATFPTMKPKPDFSAVLFKLVHYLVWSFQDNPKHKNLFSKVFPVDIVDIYSISNIVSLLIGFRF